MLDFLDNTREFIVICIRSELLSQTRSDIISFFSAMSLFPFYLVIKPLLRMKQFVRGIVSAYIKILIARIIINSDLMQKTDNLNFLRRKNQAFKEYRKTYEQTLASIEATNKKRQESSDAIRRECEAITDTLKKLKQKSKEFLSHCREALEDGKRNQEVISVAELASYLKGEKGVLKSMAEQGQNTQSSDLNLHEMLGKVEFERSLRRAKKVQLEEEIKFLEGSVLVKGNFIYNPASSLLISPAEEKENNAKLTNLVGQLERVIKLSIPCGHSSNGQSKLSLLNSQATRLQECEELLTQERQKLTKFSQFLAQRKEAQYKFSYESTLDDSVTQQEEISQYTQLQIDEQQLDKLLQSAPIPTLIISKEHSFSQLEASISSLRDRIRKAQKMHT